MKRVTVYKGDGTSVTIEAPKDKGMVFDNGLLQHGILALGEFGPSGVKIGAFADWSHAIFDAADHGYLLTLDDGIKAAKATGKPGGKMSSF